MAKFQYVLSYDISDNKRRRKLVQIMQGVARRVQYSVFESFLSAGELKKTISLVMPYIKTEKGDSLRIYRVCENCKKSTEHIGGILIDWEADIFFDE